MHTVKAKLAVEVGYPADTNLPLPLLMLKYFRPNVEWTRTPVSSGHLIRLTLPIEGDENLDAVDEEDREHGVEVGGECEEEAVAGDDEEVRKS